MEKKHTLKSKIILFISIIGFSGGFLVPIPDIIYTTLQGEIPLNWTIFVFFLIFVLLCLFGMILYALTRKISKEDRFRRYAFLLSGIGLGINGFWLIIGFVSSSY
ncbi:MAG TPA: hypothetical protein DSN98_03580 [Thermoplasmata archaeon]|jgi:hypothetical protein|nr:MAG TPA: hypothetical protein DSN98_03580 [Thermoplasmata archaeon]